MKCPKCGFNSFEYYDSCKRCSADLSGFKRTYSIASVVLPLEAKEKLVAEFKSAESPAEEVSANVETHDDIFSFNLPNDSPSTSSQHNDDPFNFDEPAMDIKQTNGVKFEDNAFADLLESTPRNNESPFAAAQVTAAPAEVKGPASSPAPGEFDLESFSWDEAPAPATPDGSGAVKDDFDSLSGDAKKNSSK